MKKESNNKNNAAQNKVTNKSTNKSKDTTKQKVTSAEKTPPAEDPTVVETTAEEVNAKESVTNVPTKVSLEDFILQEGDRLSADGYVNLLNVAERRISKMKPNESSTVKMEQMLDYNLAWALLKGSVQAHEEKKKYKILAPNDDIVVQDFIDTFNSLGVALEAHKDEDAQQTVLEFKDVPEKVVEEVKEEIETEKTPPASLDPNDWHNDEEAKNGLAYIMVQQRTSFGNRLNEALMKTRVYRKNQEIDEAKKATWDSVDLGSLFKDTVGLLGNKSTALWSGLCRGTISAMIADHNMIFSHCTIKKNLPALNDTEAASLLKAFIDIYASQKNESILDTLAVKYGILEPTRDDFLSIPSNAQLAINMKDDNSEKVRLAKKIMAKLLETNKDELVKTDPQFMLKATNKMIEIRNLYVDKDAAFAAYTESEYPKSISA